MRKFAVPLVTRCCNLHIQFVVTTLGVVLSRVCMPVFRQTTCLRSRLPRNWLPLLYRAVDFACKLQPFRTLQLPGAMPFATNPSDNGPMQSMKPDFRSFRGISGLRPVLHVSIHQGHHQLDKDMQGIITSLLDAHPSSALECGSRPSPFR